MWRVISLPSSQLRFINLKAVIPWPILIRLLVFLLNVARVTTYDELWEHREMRLKTYLMFGGGTLIWHLHKGSITALLFHLCYYLVLPDWCWRHNGRTNSSTAQTDRSPTVTAVTELPSVPTASTSLPLHAVTCFTFPLFFPLQGSIQQLVIKDDPRVAEEQCEDDDPYVRHSVTCCWNANLSNTKPQSA